MNWLGIGAILAGIGVAAGAFGAHGLKALLAPDLLTVFEVGVRYQVYHALALLAVGLATTHIHGRGAPWFHRAGWLFLAGIVLFAGSLYLLALTGTRGWGAVTPLGGVCFLAGWLSFATGALQRRAPGNEGS
ncbi:MAG: DUF423 domain-containing protein [Candidatus Eisenbacteria bacterium]